MNTPIMELLEDIFGKGILESESVKLYLPFLEKEKQMVIDAIISVAGLNHASPTDDNSLQEAEDYYNQKYNP